MGVKGKKQNRHPGHFKQTAVEDLINNGLGYREAGKKYGVAGTLIAIWEEKYLSEGPESLYTENRGKSKTSRPAGFSHSDEAKLKRLRKKLAGMDGAPLDENERMELNRLRMENALLKKLQALVQK
jgi:transposase-like protein